MGPEHWQIQWPNLMVGLDLEQGLRGAPVLRGSHLHYPVIFALLDPDKDPKHWIQ